MSGESRGASEGRGAGRLRGLLVAGQIALCLSLVVSAGLLARSLWSMASTPIGLDASGITVAATPLPGARYETPESSLQFHTAVAERLAALPGVTEVATANHVPRGDLSSNTFVIDGRPWPAGAAEPWAEWTAVSDAYFGTLRIPLLQGRSFDSRDRPDGELATVILLYHRERDIEPRGCPCRCPDLAVVNVDGFAHHIYGRKGRLETIAIVPVCRC